MKGDNYSLLFRQFSTIFTEKESEENWLKFESEIKKLTVTITKIDNQLLLNLLREYCKNPITNCVIILLNS
jgi:hypothetical protein